MSSVLAAGCSAPVVAKFSASTRRAVSRKSVVVRAQKQVDVSRREAAAGVAAVSSLLVAQPALAFLGFGENKAEIYEKETADILKQVNEVVNLDRDDPNKEQRINDVRKATNQWVAKYRRDDTFAGRPSYSNTYSVLNALAGHYNSFGLDAPFPKKRLSRMEKELSDAEKFLSRGR
ncbi:hypothetical protein BSKO_06246 [Bryopsis sp. KO-2023]|nr:hypothetical protein BSKO_06246 [Bryopsis sp. KO-2023]